MKQILLLITAITISTGCRQEETEKQKEAVDLSTISIDHVVATVRAEAALDINESSLFSLLWKSSQGYPIKPSDYLIGNIVSRIPSRDLFVAPGSKRKNILKIINPKTGQELMEAIIPESILQNHRTLDDSSSSPGHFKYATCRNKGDVFLLVQATQGKHSGTWGNRHGSGVGTALYCCTIDGSILWTFLGKLTHSIVVIPRTNQSDVIVIAQGSNQLVLLSVEGKEIGRINTPIFNAVEIREENGSGVIKFYILSDNIYCYALADNLLSK